MKSYKEIAKFISKESVIPRIDTFLSDINKIPHIEISDRQIDIYGLNLDNKEIILKVYFCKNERNQNISYRRMYRSNVIRSIISVAAKHDMYRTNDDIKGDDIMRFIFRCGDTWK